jgi:hypothetical protein
MNQATDGDDDDDDDKVNAMRTLITTMIDNAYAHTQGRSAPRSCYSGTIAS